MLEELVNVIAHVKELYQQGAVLYCWSSGGAHYAQEIAAELGIDDCFVAFLPKPVVAIDDIEFSKWRNLLQVHPNECDGHTIESYQRCIDR